MAAAIGALAKLGIDSANPVTKAFDFKTESLVVAEDFLDASGLRGTRSHNVERVRRGIRRVAGPITMEPTAAEWALLLPWVLGAAASGTTYALAETLPTRYVTVARDDTSGKVFTYDGCAVSRATIRSSQNQPVELTVEVVGKDEAVANAATFPALTLDITTPIFTHTDLVLSIAGTEYKVKDLTVTIDNGIDAERFNNSLTLTDTVPQDRTISLSATLMYGDATAAYNTGPGGVAVTATWTHPDTAVSLLLSFVKVVFPRRSPAVQGRSEITLALEGMAKQSGTTKELVITLDSTP